MGMRDGFENTVTRPVASFDAYRAGSLVYAIGGLSTVMPRQRLKRPVGIRHHSDLAFRSDQDAHLGAYLTLPGGIFGSVQDFAGPFSQMHTLISRRPAEILVEKYSSGREVRPCADVGYDVALAVPLPPGQVFTPATHAS